MLNYYPLKMDKQIGYYSFVLIVFCSICSKHTFLHSDITKLIHMIQQRIHFYIGRFACTFNLVSFFMTAIMWFYVDFTYYNICVFIGPMYLTLGPLIYHTCSTQGKKIGYFHLVKYITTYRYWGTFIVLLFIIISFPIEQKVYKDLVICKNDKKAISNVWVRELMEYSWFWHTNKWASWQPLVRFYKSSTMVTVLEIFICFTTTRLYSTFRTRHSFTAWITQSPINPLIYSYCMIEFPNNWVCFTEGFALDEMYFRLYIFLSKSNISAM